MRERPVRILLVCDDVAAAERLRQATEAFVGDGTVPKNGLRRAQGKGPVQARAIRAARDRSRYQWNLDETGGRRSHDRQIGGLNTTSGRAPLPVTGRSFGAPLLVQLTAYLVSYDRHVSWDGRRLSRRIRQADSVVRGRTAARRAHLAEVVERSGSLAGAGSGDEGERRDDGKDWQEAHD